MELQHVNVKLFVRDPERIDLEALIPIFHGWIRSQSGGELLLDIADYRHVSAGPGVVLVGHHGNFSLDNAGDRWGVRYNRKTALGGTNQDRLVQATQAALAACRRLENDPQLGGALQFDGHEIEVFINDRLLSPNTSQARAALEAELRVFLSGLFGDANYSLEYSPDDRGRLAVRIRTPQAFDTAALSGNLNAIELAYPPR